MSSSRPSRSSQASRKSSLHNAPARIKHANGSSTSALSEEDIDSFVGSLAALGVSENEDLGHTLASYESEPSTSLECHLASRQPIEKKRMSREIVDKHGAADESAVLSTSQHSESVQPSDSAPSAIASSGPATAPSHHGVSLMGIGSGGPLPDIPENAGPTRTGSRITQSSGISPLPPEGREPSLVGSELSSIATNYSVPSSLASAVSGIPTFDPESGEHDQLSRVLHYECPLHAICTQHAFVDINAWRAHCLSHFQRAGPPVAGSLCPFCDLEFRPAMMERTGRKPLPQSDILKLEKLARRKTKTAHEMYEEYRIQAETLWEIRQRHVAEHFERYPGRTNAAARPEIGCFRHLRNWNIISDGQYKELLGVPHHDPADEHGAAVTSSAGGRQGEPMR